MAGTKVELRVGFETEVLFILVNVDLQLTSSSLFFTTAKTMEAFPFPRTDMLGALLELWIRLGVPAWTKSSSRLRRSGSRFVTPPSRLRFEY